MFMETNTFWMVLICAHVLFLILPGMGVSFFIWKENRVHVLWEPLRPIHPDPWLV
jgi:hypothetical protein